MTGCRCTPVSRAISLPGFRGRPRKRGPDHHADREVALVKVVRAGTRGRSQGPQGLYLRRRTSTGMIVLSDTVIVFVVRSVNTLVKETRLDKGLALLTRNRLLHFDSRRSHLRTGMASSHQLPNVTRLRRDLHSCLTCLPVAAPAHPPPSLSK